MRIPKVVRVPLYCVIAFTLTGVTIALTRPFVGWFSVVLGLLLLPIYNIIGGMPIDGLDYWLRRKSKDPVWLMTQEGRQWLESEAGQRWQQLKSSSSV